MKIEGNKITADEGNEIYNISNPEIYGKIIHVGKNDSIDNWGERDETVIKIGDEFEIK